MRRVEWIADKWHEAARHGIRVEQLRVSPWPFSRYLESAVLLKTMFHGQEGGFPVIKPVTTRIPRQGGHHLGFPTFVTPSITLADDGNGGEESFSSLNRSSTTPRSVPSVHHAR